MARAGLELMILLPWLLQCWGFRLVSLDPGFFMAFSFLLHLFLLLCAHKPMCAGAHLRVEADTGCVSLSCSLPSFYFIYCCMYNGCEECTPAVALCRVGSCLPYYVGSKDQTQVFRIAMAITVTTEPPHHLIPFSFEILQFGELIS